MSDDDELLFLDPNGGAYEKREERVGPPLTYLGEKLESSLLASHEVMRNITRYVPDDLIGNDAMQRAGLKVRDDYLLAPARSAFWYTLVAYLGLYNMLGLATQEMVERLLHFTPEELRGWLRRIEREGTTTS